MVSGIFFLIMSSNKIVVVTGASSGIGEATARHFSKLGHPVVLLARRVERLEAMGLPNSLAVKVDVTDRAAVVAAVEKAKAHFGGEAKVDLVVNNAGVMLLGHMASQDPSEFDTMIDVNVKGVLNVIHATLKDMRERKSGTIVNISSIAGFKTFPNHAAYCATKFGVHGMTETLREEVSQDDVRITLVSPGAVETELLGHTTDEGIKDGYQEWKKSMGEEGVLAADDVVRAIDFVYQAPQHVCIREVSLAATRQGP